MKKRTTAPLGNMNPKVDFAFKYVFGNPEYPEITISLLNSIITLPDNNKIIDVKLINPNMLQRSADDKYSIMDIRALANNNMEINIEMQIANKGDMIERSLHYMSRMIGDQLKKGNKYKTMHQTICINFIDFELFHDNKDIHNEFVYRNKNNETLTNLTQIHFIELPKAEKGGIIDKEMLGNWVKFLNNPNSKEVNMLVGEHSEMKKAKKILSLADLRERIRQRYYDRQDRILEKNSWKDYEKELRKKVKEKIVYDIREEGRAEGLQEGIEKGIEKGISIGEQRGSHTKAIETARNFLAMGLSAEQVAKGTGLTLSEIQALQ